MSRTSSYLPSYLKRKTCSVTMIYVYVICVDLNSVPPPRVHHTHCHRKCEIHVYIWMMKSASKETHVALPSFSHCSSVRSGTLSKLSKRQLRMWCFTVSVIIVRPSSFLTAYALCRWITCKSSRNWKNFCHRGREEKWMKKFWSRTGKMHECDTITCYVTHANTCIWKCLSIIVWLRDNTNPRLLNYLRQLGWMVL